MVSAVSTLRTSSHSHVLGSQCPVCDQPIPNEKAEHVRARLEAKEREASDAVATRLKEQFAAERVQIEANARGSVEKITRDHATNLAAAKAEAAKREADAATGFQEKIAALTNAAAAIKHEAIQKEAAARAEGAQAARVDALAEIAALKQTNASQAANAQAQIEALELQKADAVSAAQQKIAEAEALKAKAEAAASERIAAAEAARAAAEKIAKGVREHHETTLNERLQEQREALEKDKAIALSARDAKHFEENQKFKDKLDEVQRKLEKKTADELGEGGEVDLFEELKAHFEGDRIKRVPKGTPGADIIHEIVESGRLCGKIVYDSKKRQSWKTEYATKLCEDKIAEGADHAILSLMKFPADSRQLDVRDGVILANPARVRVIAEIVREHVVRLYGLRLSAQERERKTHELYSYITSERFQQHMDSIEKYAEDLLDIDVNEERAHRKVWQTRGGILKALHKAHGNLTADVARIIGTSDAAEPQ